MIWYVSVLNSEQQVAQLLILKIAQSLQPTLSKSTLILKEENKNPKEDKFKRQVISSDPVSVTGWAMTFSRSFLALPHFSICESGQEFLPVLSHSDAVRDDGYLHSFLNIKEATKRKKKHLKADNARVCVMMTPTCIKFYGKSTGKQQTVGSVIIPVSLY